MRHDGGGGSVRDAVLDQTSRLLEFLAALARDVGPATVRDVSQYDISIWPGDVPNHHGVLLGPSDTRAEWLTVRRVADLDPPTPPARIAELVDIPSVADAFGSPRLVDPDSEDRDDALNEDRALAEQVLDQWTRVSWEPWSVRARAARTARSLYEKLYQLHLRAERDEATHEIVWGRALLSWSPGSARIRAPILTVPVTVDIDETDGSISVAPERGIELELDAIEGLGLPGVDELVGLRTRLREAPPDPWSTPEMLEVRQQFLAPLGLNARAEEGVDVLPPGPHPVLNDGWVLFLRPRPVRHERFYTELSQVLMDTGFLPEALAAIVADEQRVSGALSALGQSSPENDGTADRILMPLPTNVEQERIARQLSTSRGVTVQGPPGTGKSHTIVNLVSHLVAQGKRVLVTAQNEQALAVLRDKIPVELRDLSVAVLGSTPAAMDQLRASVQSVMDSAAGLDVEREQRKIRDLGLQVDALREDQRRTDLALVEALRGEEREFVLPAGSARAPDVAIWLARHQQLNLVPDALRADAQLPLSHGELIEFFGLATDIEASDASGAVLDFPKSTDVPSGSELAAKVDRLDQLRSAMADLEHLGLRVEALDALRVEECASAAARARHGAARLQELSGAWEERVGRELVRSPEFSHHWRAHREALRGELGQAMEIRRFLGGHEVVVPTGDHREQTAVLEEMASRFAAGKGIPKLGSRDLRELHDAVRVDGLALRTVDEVRLAQWSIKLRVVERGLRTRLVQISNESGTPAPDEGPGFLAGAQEIVSRIEQLEAWYLHEAPAMNADLGRYVSIGVPAGSVASLGSAAAILEGAAARFEERRIAGDLEELRVALEERSRASSASPLWGLLVSALARRDWTAWRQTIEESERLAEVRPRVLRRATLSDRLSAVAPLWSRQILVSRGAASAAGDPAEAELLWTWRTANTWLDDLHAAGEVSQLMARAHAEAAELRRLVLDLANRSARLALKLNLKDQQRRALSAWLNALGRRGKGTGKYAPKWEAQARKELPVAMGAIPVWIMPIHRVVDNFDPTRSELFDVVIVDESSQCDLLSAGVLALGRKAVVVGDDKQTSPAAVGVDRERISKLQSAHIPDVDHKELLTLDESLYAIAERAFPSVILLREHFRCVPEIIGFSNRYYSGRILPLRETSRPQIGQPLHAVHVTDGAAVSSGSHRVNPREAEKLVDKVVECAADPAYDGLTFGVVALQSGPQSQIIEAMLLERLGLVEFQRRHLRVGNAANFQGDERHVVFISVVADSNSFAATRTPDKQRVNVAASRAQDQLWVFHTVDPATLHADDERKALIEYVRDADKRKADVTDLFELTESKFERDVLQQILDRGYEVVPQYRVGAYRIDMVVKVAQGERLAVECDGDQFHGPEQWDNDVRRQRVLERLGWSFWRVRASAYYRDPDVAMASLWERLDRQKERARQAAERSAARAKAEEERATIRARDLAAASAPAGSDDAAVVNDGVGAGKSSPLRPALDGLQPTTAVTVSGAVPPPSVRAVSRPNARATVIHDPARSAPSDSGPQPAEVRAWARRAGIHVGERGRIAPELVSLYLESHRPQTADVRPAVGSERAAPASSTQEAQPAPDTDRRPRQAAPDLEQPLLRGRKYRMAAAGDVTAKEGGPELAQVIGVTKADQVKARIKRVKPHGGVLWVDDWGVVTALTDKEPREPVFITRVNADDWFPSHWR